LSNWYAAGQGASHDSNLPGGKGGRQNYPAEWQTNWCCQSVSTGSEFRNNMAAGGTVVKTEITEQEQIIYRNKPGKDGLFFCRH